MRELQPGNCVRALREHGTRVEDKRKVARDLAAPAAGKQSHDWPRRIEPVLHREFFATLHWSDDIDERMPHEIDGYARVAIDFLFEREDYNHTLYEALDYAHAARPPRPYLRSDEVPNWNSDVLQSPRDAEVGPW